MKKILIDTNSINGRRSALIDGENLIDFDLEFEGNNFQKGSIHKGKITKIEGSLEAIFVEMGSSRHGFLPFKELSAEYFDPSKTGDERFKISEGDDIVVQIQKEERVNKGAALSTYVSLASRYIVLMTNHPNGGGISRRIHGEERDKIKSLIEALDVPESMSLIIRTAGIDKQIEELKWDLAYLKKLWVEVESAIKGSKSTQLIYADQSLIQKTIRDYFKEDIGELVVDNETDYNSAKTYANKIVPDFIEKIKLYDEEVPLFASYGIESKIESAFSREVKLKSGASIVIDSGEALTSIDINSAKSTKGGDIEETALKTNLEAAAEIGKQLKLRDLGGLIVIDFIDMEDPKSNEKVERAMYASTKQDHARIQLDKISRFGLMEMSRQRIKPALNDLMGKTIWVRSVASICESVFRLITEKSINNKSSILMLKVSPNVANELLNRYRSNLDQLEKKFSNKIMTFIDPYKQNDNYTIEIKKNAYFDYEYELDESSKAFQNRTTYNLKVPKKSKKALVEDVEFRNIPKVDSNKKGILNSLFDFFKGEEEEKPKRKRFNDRRGRANSNRKPRQNRNTNKPFRGNKKFGSNNKSTDSNSAENIKKTPTKTKKTVKASVHKKPAKPKSGNIKLAPEPTPKPVDDNIGNRIEPKKKKTVKRAKNDPRA
ncbi:MAG: Rne/Rng family ribonuclease [Gammaproteobacteria bacterium TMED112]|nr:MAG: Rne/Rng family ribonuclease [Gammaproteobacteria bacterium TMED112]|tara:strand:+ start:2205 stop:4184 length:1980 start_codon:yes stop_codon:yes gene_type:complete